MDFLLGTSRACQKGETLVVKNFVTENVVDVNIKLVSKLEKQIQSWINMLRKVNTYKVALQVQDGIIGVCAL